MNYKVGDTVICIDAISDDAMAGELLRAGTKYVMAEIVGSCVGLVGVTIDFSAFKISPCGYCNTNSGPWWHFRGRRFIKLDGLDVRAERIEMAQDEHVVKLAQEIANVLIRADRQR